MNCCICGPVKNCGPYLKKVLENMEKIGSIFDDYIILLYYDTSSDNTLNILKNINNKIPKCYFMSIKIVSQSLEHIISQMQEIVVYNISEIIKRLILILS